MSKENECIETPAHMHELHNSLSEAHGVHGHSHGVGKGEDQADGSTQLRAEAATDQEVGPTWG